MGPVNWVVDWCSLTAFELRLIPVCPFWLVFSSGCSDGVVLLLTVKCLRFLLMSLVSDVLMRYDPGVSTLSFCITCPGIALSGVCTHTAVLSGSYTSGLAL
jgi:hypothetical protein